MTKTLTKPKSEPEEQVDLREQLFNDGAVGQIEEISTQDQLVTQLRGILLDIDPILLAPSWLIADPTKPAADIYQQYVAGWLSRHPVLRKAEVRGSGNGLHVLLMLDEPLIFKDDKEKIIWDSRVEIAQTILPTDPNAPGLNAMTRPIGSINGKNGARVELLKRGEGVAAKELVEMTGQLVEEPFKTITSVLTGRSRLAPCPICSHHESTLGAGPQNGSCYKCGKVSLGKFLHTIYASVARATTKQSEVDSE